MSELPDDLLEEIFFRLPATSLNRLRSTCKQWNRLLKDTEFTRKHLEKAPKQFQSLMMKQSGVCLMHINIDRFPHVMIKGEATLTDPDQIKIMQVSHCDGLLLCYIDPSRLVVWNPCTGQTRWIQPRDRFQTCCKYTLGSYQDKKSIGKSYKILRHRWHYSMNNQEFEIYEINSNSWRIIDVTIDFKLEWLDRGVSLEGKTYWVDANELGSDRYIICFDYSAERFARLCLPGQYGVYKALSLSVVREEKLAVLLQHHNREKTEIWVTNKMNETKEVSWSKALPVEIDPYLLSWMGSGNFLFDDEKKVLTVCYGDDKTTWLFIVGEVRRVRKVDFKSLSTSTSRPFLFSYVPILIQLQQV